MNKFGVLKSKILKKLTESYSNKNKNEVKDILNTIKENKDFKEMYLFYEEIENKYIDDKETAQLFVEGVINILKQQVGDLSNFCTSLNKMINSGVDTFIEIGPGKVLSGMIKRIDRKLKVFNVENMDSLEKISGEM